MSTDDKVYVVHFQRIGPYRGISFRVTAPSVAHLEAPLREVIKTSGALPQSQADGLTITYDEDSLKGELNYGLVGEFTIVPPKS